MPFEFERPEIMPHTLYHGGSVFDADVETVCELFAACQGDKVFDFLRQHAESPLQVPFLYLHLIRTGRLKPGQAGGTRPTAWQVELAYRAILQRAPEDQGAVQDHVNECESVEQLVTRLLSSREMVLRMPELQARAFPMDRRLWHVHIPKTAGSSFCEAALAAGWGSVNTNILSGAEGKLDLIAKAVRQGSTPSAPTIITGHWRLMNYLHSIGPFDRVVTFVRDPVECMVSEFNYLADVCNLQPNVHQVDPQPFLDQGFDPECFESTYDRGFFSANVQCSHLADDATCATALRNLETCRAELLPITAVSRAMATYFPDAAPKRVNVSTKRLKFRDLDQALREEICVRSGQDYLLHHIAEVRYAESQTARQSPLMRVSADAA